MIPCDVETSIKPSITIDRDAALSIVFESLIKLTSQTYIKEIKSKFDISLMEAKKVLQQFIDEQELCYQYHFGATYIEKSFLKPVRISNHFILQPSGIPGCSKDPDDIGIIIEQGISFGSGQHPTTQLCLQAIDYCFFDCQMFKNTKSLISADIGTGSGVLAMALCKAGVSLCKAYEIDPISVHEARRNVVHNQLEQHIQVLDMFMPESKDTYDVICANLRFPTLKTLSDMIKSSLKDNGIAILSGVREWEKQDLITQFSNIGFSVLWQADDKNWSAFVLRKKLC
ncbi:MAG: 50S ribosomal protein L11 methyltransferase [Pseudomonadota bacterium]